MINQGGHPIALVSMVTTLCEKSLHRMKSFLRMTRELRDQSGLKKTREDIVIIKKVLCIIRYNCSLFLLAQLVHASCNDKKFDKNKKNKKKTEYCDSAPVKITITTMDCSLRGDQHGKTAIPHDACRRTLVLRSVSVIAFTEMTKICK